MFVDARELPDGETLEADVAIVGAGPAGIVMARRLAPTRMRVCLLESGGLDFDRVTQALAEGAVVGRAYFDLDAARLRWFGGTSNHWTGWCRPLDPIDFEARPGLPLTSWPITYADLADYYREAQRLCELGPFTYDATDFTEDMPPLFRQSLEPAGLGARVWQCSPPTRFGEIYRADLAEPQHVQCVLYANVTGFEMVPGGPQVRALRVQTLTGKSLRVAARAFVLATGGIENARLMLLPAPDRPRGVGNDEDQVGRYFMLHPILDVGRVVASGDPGLAFESASADYGVRVRGGLGLHAAEQRRLEVPNHAFQFEPNYAFVEAPPSRGYEALRRLATDPPWREPDLLLSDLRDVLTDLDGVASRLYERVRPEGGLFGRGEPQAGEAAEGVYDVVLRMEHLPNPDSRVVLVEARDRLGLPQAGVDWRFREGEKLALRRTVERLGQGLGQMAAGRLQMAEWLSDDAAPWPDWVNGDFHHMGTTRMSDSPRAGVVDRDCRGHGVPNLYVAGSSVFATSGFANPTLTIVALSLRLADHLHADLAHAVELREEAPTTVN